MPSASQPLPPPRWRAQLARVTPLILIAVMVVRQWLTPGGPTPAAEQLIAAGGGLGSWRDGPRAYLLHANLTHLLINIALSVFLGALWCHLGRFGDPTDRTFVRGPLRIFAATLLAILAGTLSLTLAAALTPEARVGASGGVYALVAGLLVAVWLRRHQLPKPLRARLLPNLTLVTVPFVGLQFIGGDGVDWLSHILGFALGFPLAVLCERPRGVLVGAVIAGAWFIIAWA